MSSSATRSNSMNTFDRASIVKAFCEECVWLRSIRTHFASLFEGNDRRGKLLHEVAGTFFHDMNLILAEYILLQQCKLTDPASSGGEKENLTTNFLLQLNWPSETEALLRAQNGKLMCFRQKIEDARHKLIGHLDLRARLGATAFGNFHEGDELVFWDALQAFVDAAHAEAVGGPYEINAAMPEGDAESLVHCLKDAMDYDDIVNTDPKFLVARLGHRRYEDA